MDSATADSTATHPNTEIPSHVLESLARCLLPDIQAFFESAEGQREFEKWMTQRMKS